MSTPFFSIVIPAYNRASLLPSTLESIWKQSFSDFEVLLVNDGSTDKTGELLVSIQNEEPRLKIISQENTERGAARNNGWKNASGKYVVFFDSDDLMHPTYLQEMHKIIEATHPELVCGKIQFQDEKGGIKQHIDQKGLFGLYNYKLFLKGNPIACHFAVKNTIHAFKPFHEDRDLASMEDWIFLLQNTQSRYIYIHSDPLVTMRIHSEQSMKQDQTIAQRKLQALDYLERNVQLGSKEFKLLKGYAFENIGIHFVNSRYFKDAISMFWKSFKLKGPSIKMIYNFMRMGVVFMKNHSK